MKKVAIIEDNEGISHSLKLYLENSNFETCLHNTGKKAEEFIQESNPDIIILDINLPVQDGVTICKKLREYSEVPVIMLTARGSEIDKISGFESGADDYISKPFSPRELLARMESLLRRVSRSEKEEENANILTFQNITLDTKKMSLTVGGENMSMTKNEFEITQKIFEENGNIVSRETIMKEIIGYNEYVFDRTIDTHIKNIRKKLGEKDVILTVRGEGYRLNK